MNNPQALKISRSSEFAVPVEDLWAFHMRPEALGLLSPPFSGFRVLDRGSGVDEGSILRASIGLWPLHRRWVALHSGVAPNRGFTDIALESPFPYWVHIHRFESIDLRRSRLTDTVWFVPPRVLGKTLGRIVVKPILELMFAWRHRVTRREVETGQKKRCTFGNHIPLCGQQGSGGTS